MKSKVEDITTINDLKVYIRKNSFESKINSKSIFDYWRCGYIEFNLPEGLPYAYYFKDCGRRSKGVALTIENIIDGANVHGGITYIDSRISTRTVTLGFDCNHYIDTKEFINKPRSVGYCLNELQRLSKAILKAKRKYRSLLIKQKIKEIKRAYRKDIVWK